MNPLVIKLVEDAISLVDDNLARARMQQRAMPSWKSGNDESIDSVISGYQKRKDELETALKEIGGNPNRDKRPFRYD